VLNYASPDVLQQSGVIRLSNRETAGLYRGDLDESRHLVQMIRDVEPISWKVFNSSSAAARRFNAQHLCPQAIDIKGLAHCRLLHCLHFPGGAINKPTQFIRMEEPEVPLEQVHEELHHASRHGESWTLGVALTAAVLAGLAAITSLLSGHHANEGMLEQIHASDQWNYYQSKGIKAAVLSAKIELLNSLGKSPEEKDHAKAAEYKKEQEEIFHEAKEREKVSQAHMHSHVVFARGVTLFQVAIAISAMAVLIQERRFWYLGILFGIIGIGFLVQGLLSQL
jgi:hypothetical protein